ncbi:MAG: recombinase zinc beta ribbon domain-containing protein [Thiohalorhabdaceae bacterium]
MCAGEFWKHRRAKHLLTGLVVCGSCGERFADVGRDHLACSAARGRGTCANTRSIKRGRLEGLILEALRQRLMEPDLVEEFIAAFHAEVNRQRGQAAAEHQRKQRELTQVQKRIDGLVEAIADGLRSEGPQQKLDELEQRAASLKHEIAEAEQPAPRLHPNLSSLYRERVAQLHDALQDPDEGQHALEVLRGLIERVEISPDASGEGLEIELVGAIAQMVETALQGQHEKAALSGRAAGSVKVVAGVGFEPTTFRL